MPAWSNISCAQWIWRLRVPKLPFSVIGVRPAAQEQRHAVAREVGDIVDRVGGADIDMHHHRLRPAGHQVGAMRHGDREILVRHKDRLRHLGVGCAARLEGLDDRREVGARVGEEIVDAMGGERAQENLARDRGVRARNALIVGQSIVGSRCQSYDLRSGRPFSKKY